MLKVCGSLKFMEGAVRVDTKNLVEISDSQEKPGHKTSFAERCVAVLH